MDSIKHKENKMDKKFFLFITIILFIFSSGCAPAMSEKSISNEIYAEEAPMAMASEPLQDFAADEAEYREMDLDTFGDTSGSIERVVIKNADITIVVDDPAISMKEIISMTNNYGGFVVNSHLYKSYTENGIEVPEANMTIRVPAEFLDDALDKIKSLVMDKDSDILNESISGEDVTKEYTDLNSRLKNLEQAEIKLNEIMDSATETEDVLSVYNQLKAVGEEIEVIKGQIKYYEEAAALSAIYIQIRSSESIQPITIGKWQPVGVARDALQALINVLKFLVNAFIWIIILLLPVLIILAIPIWIIVKLLKRRKRTKKIKEAKDIDQDK